MSEKRASKLPPLEEGLLQAMQALDKQVSREMQRTPAERESKGVQKWEPFERRIEGVSSFILNALGDESVALDSLIILSQSLTKALYLITEDLGREGLGEVRSSYCRAAMEGVRQDAGRALDLLKGGPEIN